MYQENQALKQVAERVGTGPFPLIERLRAEESRMSERLANIKAFLTLAEKNPDTAEMMQVLSKIGL